MGRKPQSKVKNPAQKASYILRKIKARKPVSLEEKGWLKDYQARKAARQKQYETQQHDLIGPIENYRTVSDVDVSPSPTIEESLPNADENSDELPPIDVRIEEESPTDETPTEKKPKSKNPFSPSDEQKSARDAAMAELVAKIQAQVMVGGPDMLAGMWIDYFKAMNDDNREAKLIAWPAEMVDGLIEPCIRLSMLRYCPPFNPDRVAPVVAVGTTATTLWQHRKFRKMQKKEAEANVVTETPPTVIEPPKYDPPIENDTYKSKVFVDKIPGAES